MFLFTISSSVSISCFLSICCLFFGPPSLLNSFSIYTQPLTQYTYPLLVHLQWRQRVLHVSDLLLTLLSLPVPQRTLLHMALLACRLQVIEVAWVLLPPLPRLSASSTQILLQRVLLLVVLLSVQWPSIMELIIALGSLITLLLARPREDIMKLRLILVLNVPFRGRVLLLLLLLLGRKRLIIMACMVLLGWVLLRLTHWSPLNARGLSFFRSWLLELDSFTLIRLSVWTVKGLRRHFCLQLVPIVGCECLVQRVILHICVPASIRCSRWPCSSKCVLRVITEERRLRSRILLLLLLLLRRLKLELLLLHLMDLLALLSLHEMLLLQFVHIDSQLIFQALSLHGLLVKQYLSPFKFLL